MIGSRVIVSPIGVVDGRYAAIQPRSRSILSVISRSRNGMPGRAACESRKRSINVTIIQSSAIVSRRCAISRYCGDRSLTVSVDAPSG